MSDPNESASDQVSAKEKFRDALDRKRESEHRTVEGRANTGAVHGPETHGSKRTFRRKTG